MPEPQMRKRIGESEFILGDCQVWAGIYYLDSPTDYREYLPGHSLQQSVSYEQVKKSELELLDELPTPLSVLNHLTMSKVVAIARSPFTSIRRMLRALRSA